MKQTFLSIILLLSVLTGCTRPTEKQEQYTDYVNLFIGTGGHGHTFPGPVAPHGMIQPSPDTRIYEWDACSGYHYSDSVINGFSHTHLSGTGCGDYGDVLLMPTTGTQEIQDLGSESQEMAYASPFSHDEETAVPGYYSVFLKRYGVKAELTATKRAALHRYTFPQNRESGFIVDLDYSLQRQKNEEMHIEAISDTEIVGWKRTNGWAEKQNVGFYMQFSKPFTCEIIDTPAEVERGGKQTVADRAKALLRFETETDEEVLVKVGISAVDIDGARRNVEQEIPSWAFDSIATATRNEWNDYLKTVQVESNDETSKRIFYTALYHTAVHPSLFTDIDGRYRGMDGEIHQADTNEEIYTVYSLWDTFRALHPLLTVIDPQLNGKLIVSLMQKYREGGILPMWELAGNYTATMIGYHAVPVIVDAYMKGFDRIDGQELLQACLRSAEYDTTNIVASKRMIGGLMPISKYYKNTIGYIPYEKENESVAKGLEYAYNDWCISVLAQALGDTATAARYATLAQAYRNYFDANTKFMRGKDLNGNWHLPFNPRSSDHRNDDYCEGTAWQWAWFVPHDIEGLVELMGGQEDFTTRLDSLFNADSTIEGDLVSADISGLIGQYAHGNEPSHHITHMYNYIGQSWKTQQLVDTILYTQYFDNPDGLSGNEDCGQMSAWYVLNAMGFYQVCPGTPVYSVGRPIFDRVTINRPNGKPFVITVKNNSKENRYVQSICLNGKTLDTPFFNHSDLADGGEMVIEMGNTPLN
ncbi:MAG: GH92 family glycosyl hydrolase [Coprobacter sp.]|nr:GH92 family glycosyl hydrolase [Coprobacter sp.]